jgi:sulfur carrier protein
MGFCLKINGVERRFAEDIPLTVAELLERMKIDYATVVAEVNGRIVPRSEFGTAVLKEGSSIELVRFVGGG